MDGNEKRELENFLLREGLAGLQSGDLIDQLANLVSNYPGDQHQFLEDLINQCDADKRYEMYHAIAPRLRFKPLSLPDYEARIAMKASGLVSHRKMRVEGQAQYIEIDGHKFEQVPEQVSEAAMATLKCHLCGTVARYLSDTPAGAMIAARKDGWVRDIASNKEVCRVCNLPSEADLDAIAEEERIRTATDAN